MNFPNISHLHIFAYVFYVELVTLESLWGHKGIAMPVTH